MFALQGLILSVNVCFSLLLTIEVFFSKGFWSSKWMGSTSETKAWGKRKVVDGRRSSRGTPGSKREKQSLRRKIHEERRVVQRLRAKLEEETLLRKMSENKARNLALEVETVGRILAYFCDNAQMMQGVVHDLKKKDSFLPRSPLSSTSTSLGSENENEEKCSIETCHGSDDSVFTVHSPSSSSAGFYESLSRQSENYKVPQAH